MTWTYARHHDDTKDQRASQQHSQQGAQHLSLSRVKKTSSFDHHTGLLSVVNECWMTYQWLILVHHDGPMLVYRAEPIYQQWAIPFGLLQDVVRLVEMQVLTNRQRLMLPVMLGIQMPYLITWSYSWSFWKQNTTIRNTTKRPALWWLLSPHDMVLELLISCRILWTLVVTPRCSYSLYLLVD